MFKYTARVKGSNMSATYYKDIEVYFYDEPDEFALRGKILQVARQQMGPGLVFEIKKISDIVTFTTEPLDILGDLNEEEKIN